MKIGVVHIEDRQISGQTIIQPTGLGTHLVANDILRISQQIAILKILLEVGSVVERSRLNAGTDGAVEHNLVLELVSHTCRPGPVVQRHIDGNIDGFTRGGNPQNKTGKVIGTDSGVDSLFLDLVRVTQPTKNRKNLADMIVCMYEGSVAFSINFVPANKALALCRWERET